MSGGAALRFRVVIPARYGASRLPGKPLADLGGRPMVVRVAERARASGAEEVLVATDHPDIAEAVTRAGHTALLTHAHHASGTDRIAEAVATLAWPDDTLVVNLQGDEPLADPELVRQVARTLAEHPAASIATAAHPLRDLASMFNPNVVKVVCDRAGYALYFSRAPIPYAREAFRDMPSALPADMPALRHIGLYAYRASFLRTYAKLAVAPLERFEALEQLRALWYGHRIVVALTDRAPPAGVDTPEDLARVRAHFQT